MQRHRMSLLITALTLAIASPASGQTITTFDWVEPGPQQTGSYSTSASAVLSGGTLQLVERGDPVWTEPAAAQRVIVDIAGPSAESFALFNIDLGELPAELFPALASDGSDLLPVAIWSGEELASWLDRFAPFFRRGTLWLRAPSLPGGTSTVALYLGAEVTARATDDLELFILPSPIEAAVVLDGRAAAAEMTLTSMADDNEITVGSRSAVLAAQESLTVAPAAFDASTVITSSGPINALFDGEATDGAVPLALAGRRFVVPVLRGDANAFCVYAPWSETVVELASAGAVVATATVEAGAATLVAAEVPDSTGLIVSSIEPILLAHCDQGAAPVDATVIPPASQDILGGSTATVRLAALEDDTTITATFSGGSVRNLTLNAGEFANLSGSGGAQGTGPAVRLIADAPIAATANGDGDGGDAVALLPVEMAGHRFVLPRAAQYLFVSTLHSDTHCSLTGPDGTLIGEDEDVTLAPPTPGRIYFGSDLSGAHIPAGALLVCDGPAWAAMEETVYEQEVNLFAAQLHHPILEPAPTITASELETRFPTEQQWAVTPTYAPPDEVVSWSGFTVVEDSTTLPEGTSLQFQLSADGGTSWLFWDGVSWTAATDADGATAAEVAAGLASFATDGTLAVRAMIRSTDGFSTPIVGAIEVESDQLGGVAELQIADISDPQRAGQPFPVVIEAFDHYGHQLNEVGSLLSLSLEPEGDLDPLLSSPISGGQSRTEVTLFDTGTFELVATLGEVTGRSNSFEVVPGQGDELQYVSGDGQSGEVGAELAEDFMVRLIDITGAGAAGYAVDFTVAEGGGTMAPAIALTDANGYARSRLTLGPEPGTNRVEASAAVPSGSPVVFSATGQGTDASSDDEGCSCQAAAPSRGLISALAALIP